MSWTLFLDPYPLTRNFALLFAGLLLASACDPGSANADDPADTAGGSTGGVDADSSDGSTTGGADSSGTSTAGNDSASTSGGAMGDGCDAGDSDGDGVCDPDDVCAVADDGEDADGDGIPAGCDCDEAGQSCQSNGGSCEESSEGVSCVECPAGQYGPDCAEQCACPEAATCSDGPDGDGTCACAEGLYGDDCLGECSCGNGGECDDGQEGNGSCTCAPGFFGADCSGTCDCLNGAACDDGADGTGACTCADGFYGETCSGECTCGTGICDEGATGTGACTCDEPELTCGLTCSAPVADVTNPTGEWSTNSTLFGQSFSPSTDGRLATFSFTTFGNTGAYDLTIRAGSGLNGTILATETNVPGVTGVNTVTFSNPPILSAGSTYTALISAPDGHGHLLEFDDPYAGGQYYYSGGGISVQDLVFSTTLAPCP